MLTLTENASAIVKDISTQSQTQAGESAGLRISSDGAPEGGFAIASALQPEADDQIVEQDGATIYLDSDAAQQLDDKVLDAGIDAGGNVQFALGQQA